jgi:hypothetical protein
MTQPSDPARPAQETDRAATEADAAGMTSPAGKLPEAWQDASAIADAGLASSGEALNGGQAPQLDAGRDDDAPSSSQAGDHGGR